MCLKIRHYFPIPFQIIVNIAGKILSAASGIKKPIELANS
jgi:hypothetical protein